MSKKSKENKPSIDKATVNKILRNIPKNEGFEFFKTQGASTGKTAISLNDLVDKLIIIDIRAVNYHFNRREIERWIRSTIGDEELARRLGKLNRELHGEKLRKDMITLIKTRLEELKMVTA